MVMTFDGRGVADPGRSGVGPMVQAAPISDGGERVVYTKAAMDNTIQSTGLWRTLK